MNITDSHESRAHGNVEKATIPASFQGTIFLGKDTEPPPEYHFAFRERADDRLDNVRLIRDARYSYHKNYMPYVPSGQHQAYLWKLQQLLHGTSPS